MARSTNGGWGETLVSTTYYRISLHRDYPGRLDRYTGPWHLVRDLGCQRCFGGVGMAFMAMMPDLAPHKVMERPDLSRVAARFPISATTQLLFYEDGVSPSSGDRNFTLVLHNPGRPDHLQISYDE